MSDETGKPTDIEAAKEQEMNLLNDAWEDAKHYALGFVPQPLRNMFGLSSGSPDTQDSKNPDNDSNFSVWSMMSTLTSLYMAWKASGIVPGGLFTKLIFIGVVALIGSQVPGWLSNQFNASSNDDNAPQQQPIQLKTNIVPTNAPTDEGSGAPQPIM